MGEEVCFKCERSSEKVKLLDAIFDSEIVKICEECILIEDIPVIRMPTTSQLKESEKSYTVRERLRRMSGLPKEGEEIKELARKITEKKAEMRKIKTRREEIEEKFKIAKSRNIPLGLIDNFNWHIFMARKKKKITRGQLADMLGESEIAIKMIENKEFPDDAEKLIRKIEQFFDFELRKKITGEEGEGERAREAVRRRLENPEETRDEVKENFVNKESNLGGGGQARWGGEKKVNLRFDSGSIKNITIADLKRMKDERERLEREKEKENNEKIEEEVSDLISEITEEEEEREKQGWRHKNSKSFVGEDIELE